MPWHYYRGIFKHFKRYSKFFSKEKRPADRKALSFNQREKNSCLREQEKQAMPLL